MADVADERFKCPGCGKRFRWTSAIAGRKTRCTACNLKIRIPGAPGGKAEALEPLPEGGSPAAPPKATPPKRSAPKPVEENYDLNLDDDLMGLAPTAPVTPPALGDSGGEAKCPSCNQKVKPGAVICINCGFNLQAGKKISTKVEQATENDAPAGKARPAGGGAPTSLGGAAAALSGTRSGVAAALEDREDEVGSSSFVDLWLPAGLIVLGLGFEFAQYMYFSDSATVGAIAAATSVGINLLISIPLLLIAMLLAVKILGVAFGPLGQALFKIVAVSLGPSAIGGIVSYLIDGGGLMGLFLGDILLSFVLFWCLLSVLFSLEALEALYLIFILWVVQWVTGILVATILASMFV